jgi:hypothetical protein
VQAGGEASTAGAVEFDAVGLGHAARQVSA